jgi:hypothetical protein
MREDVIARISKVVETLWPSVQLRVFGSCATDIYLPTSDIDLCIMGANACSPSPIDELASALRRRSMGRYHTICSALRFISQIGALTRWYAWNVRRRSAECKPLLRRVCRSSSWSTPRPGVWLTSASTCPRVPPISTSSRFAPSLILTQHARTHRTRRTPFTDHSPTMHHCLLLSSSFVSCGLCP